MKIMEYEKWLQEITFVAWTTTMTSATNGRTDERTSDYYHTSVKPAKDSEAETDAGALMWVDGRRNNDDDEQSQLWLLLLLDVEIIKTH